MEFPGIDGGPLGFMTWTIPMLVGSLAYDAMTPDLHVSTFQQTAERAMGRLLVWGVVLMVLGYAIACINLWTPPNDTTGATGLASRLVEPPFVPPSRPVNIWTMSQRAGSISYLTFGSGLSLALYALFVQLADLGRLQVGIFRTLGSNALAGYIIHNLVAEAIYPYAPKDAPLWFVCIAFGVFLGICYLFIRHLEKKRLYLTL
jgi:predicted acyltransferase